MAPPGKPAPETYGANKNPGAPKKSSAYNKTWIPEPEGIAGGIPPRTINPAGIVVRDIYNVRIRRFNDNVAVFNNHPLLFRGPEISLSLRLCAQLLDRIHDLVLLTQKCISK